MEIGEIRHTTVCTRGKLKEFKSTLGKIENVKVWIYGYIEKFYYDKQNNAYFECEHSVCYNMFLCLCSIYNGYKLVEKYCIYHILKNEFSVCRKIENCYLKQECKFIRKFSKRSLQK